MLSQQFNHDLLLTEESLEAARRRWPQVFPLLDHPDLRKAFGGPGDKKGLDGRANNAKRMARHLGVTAIALCLFSLLLAAAEPLYVNLSDPFSRFLASVSAATGIAGALIGSLGILFWQRKRAWLLNRMLTERLRQLFFQFLLRRASRISWITANPEGLKMLILERNTLFDAFQERFTNSPEGELGRILNDEEDALLWLVSSDSIESPLDPNSSALEELLDVLYTLRLEYQISFASYKLLPGHRSSPLGAPLRQDTILSRTLLVCVALTFLLHLAISTLVFVAPVALALNWLHVVALWVTLTALAAHALREGLRPRQEVERYRQYLWNLQSLNREWSKATPEERLDLMQEAGEYAYRELRSFLLTHENASFSV